MTPAFIHEDRYVLYVSARHSVKQCPTSNLSTSGSWRVMYVRASVMTMTQFYILFFIFLSSSQPWHFLPMPVLCEFFSGPAISWLTFNAIFHNALILTLCINGLLISTHRDASLDLNILQFAMIALYSSKPSTQCDLYVIIDLTDIFPTDQYCIILYFKECPAPDFTRTSREIVRLVSSPASNISTIKHCIF